MCINKWHSVRLSYTTISLLHFFLIAFLTFFLKPDARAQSMLAVNFSHHHFAHERPVVEVADSDLIHSESIPEKHDGGLFIADSSSRVNFLRISTSLVPIKNFGRTCTGYHPWRMRIYSTSIQHSMRVTVKLFKVVIVPLWHLRQELGAR